MHGSKSLAVMAPALLVCVSVCVCLCMFGARAAFASICLLLCKCVSKLCRGKWNVLVSREPQTHIKAMQIESVWRVCY